VKNRDDFIFLGYNKINNLMSLADFRFLIAVTYL